LLDPPIVFRDIQVEYSARTNIAFDGSSGELSEMAGPQFLLWSRSRKQTMPYAYLVSRISRPFVGRIGRALLEYKLANAANWLGEMEVVVFKTNQVTSSEHGGVVNEPENV
jgi:hypothetical protein